MASSAPPAPAAPVPTGAAPNTPSKPPQPKSLAERRGKEQPVLWTPSPSTPLHSLSSPPRSPLTSPPGYPTPKYSHSPHTPSSPRVLIPASPTPRSPVPPPPVPLAPRCISASPTTLNVGWDSAVGMVKVSASLNNLLLVEAALKWFVARYHPLML